MAWRLMAFRFPDAVGVTWRIKATDATLERIRVATGVDFHAIAASAKKFDPTPTLEAACPIFGNPFVMGAMLRAIFNHRADEVVLDAVSIADAIEAFVMSLHSRYPRAWLWKAFRVEKRRQEEAEMYPFSLN